MRLPSSLLFLNGSSPFPTLPCSVSLVFSCNNVLGLFDVNATLIFSRTPQLPAAYPYETLIATLDGLGINTTTMSPILQGPQCKYD